MVQESHSVFAALCDGSIRFTVLKPEGTVLNRGARVPHRNGIVEPVHAEVRRNRAVVPIEP